MVWFLLGFNEAIFSLRVKPVNPVQPQVAIAWVERCLLAWTNFSALKSLYITQHLAPIPIALLTLALAGGGVDATPREDFFLRCHPNYEADRAEIWHRLWGILCATFGKKIWPGLVRSRSYDVTRGTRSGHFLREIAEYGTLEGGDIEASFDYFRSELTLWHHHHIL